MRKMINKNEFTAWELTHPRIVMFGAIINFLIMLGAVITAFWAIYLLTIERGIFGFIGGLLGASMIVRFGPAPLFAASSSLIAFAYHKTDMWLPVTSYILAVFSLGITILNKTPQNK